MAVYNLTESGVCAYMITIKYAEKIYLQLNQKGHLYLALFGGWNLVDENLPASSKSKKGKAPAKKSKSHALSLAHVEILCMLSQST